jgi:hypothetical protein
VAACDLEKVRGGIQWRRQHRIGHPVGNREQARPQRLADCISLMLACNFQFSMQNQAAGND